MARKKEETYSTYRCPDCKHIQGERSECDHCGYRDVQPAEVSAVEYCKVFGCLPRGKVISQGHHECDEWKVYNCARCGEPVKEQRQTCSDGCLIHGPLR